MKGKVSLLLLIFLCISLTSGAQNCTTLGQNPGSSFPVCGSSIFYQQNVPICGNTVVPTPCAGPGIIYQNKNPFWYQFTCFASGTLGMIITPNNLADDYDWQLFDITNRSPDEVFTDSSLFVACNWSGNSGITGTADTGTSLIECGGFGVPLFSAMPFLIQGHTYLLLVSHFTNSQSGYSLSFAGGTAQITDSTAASLLSASVSCDGLRIGVHLNKKMKCNSLAFNGSDFFIQGTTATITSASGNNCSSTFDMDSITLTLNTPLTNGTYKLLIRNGTDANTLLDNCDAGIPVGDSITFTYMAPPAPVIDTILLPSCSPQTISVVLSSPALCNSIAADGSDFSISGPSIVQIVNVQSTCTDSTTNITLSLANPIVTKGNYSISIKKGNDGNTLLNSCNIATTTGNNFSFFVADTVSAFFTIKQLRACQNDTLIFNPADTNSAVNFAWTFDGSTSANIKNPVKIFGFGQHVINLVASNGYCSDSFSLSVNLVAPPPIQYTFSTTATTCGLNNGSATAFLSGGVNPLTILWTPGNFTSNSINNLSSGKYYFSIKDSVGCRVKDSIFINAEPLPVITQVTVKNITCHSLKNGEALAAISGGLPPYTYQWNVGTSVIYGNPLINADTGNYILIISDARGCKDSQSVQIKQPFALQNVANVQPTTCGLSNGMISINTSGGTSPYYYQWVSMGITSSAANNLSAGPYKIIIKDSNSCRDTITLTVAASNALTSSITTTPLSCFNQNNGTASVAVIGSPPYSFIWSNGAPNLPTITGLAIGNYSVIIQDNKGCKDTAFTTITGPLPITNGITKTNTSCGLPNGSVTISTVGGSPPFSYQWNTSVGNGPSAVNLSSGNYQVIVSDIKGCKDTVRVNITSSFPLATTITQKNVSCFGESSGSATATSTGKAPFIYSWSPISGSTSTVTGLKAGSYSVAIQDSMGCKDTAFVTITQPMRLSNIITNQGTTCNKSNGSAQINGIGGTPPYRYQWLPIGGNNNMAVNLPAGVYKVILLDSNNCVDTGKTVITSSQALTSSYSVSHVSCNGGSNGSASIIPNGTAPYSYHWSPAGGSNSIATGLSAGNYSVIVNDSKSCSDTIKLTIKVENALSLNVSVIQNAKCFKSNDGLAVVKATGLRPFTYQWAPAGGIDSVGKGLSAGYSIVIVTDVKGCVVKDSVFISQPPPIQNNFSIIASTCNLPNGSASVNTTGGTGGCSYAWFPGNLNTFKLENIPAATYYLTTKDQNGCTRLDTVNVEAIAPPEIRQIMPNNVRCFGENTGYASALVVNGKKPYRYFWRGINLVSYDSIVKNLYPGTYSLTIKDSFNCIISDSFQIKEPEKLKVATFPENTSCGLNNGRISAAGTGGVPPFDFSWSNGSYGTSIINQPPGEYVVAVKDNNGCMATSEKVIIKTSPKLTISLGEDRPICPGFEFFLTPGNFVKYKWQDGQESANYKVNQPGFYAVDVWDSKGCKASAQIRIINKCEDLLFPGSFTPNNDNKNDFFGPLGTLLAVRDYNLRIFNRWGQMVFSSNDPFKKWDGKNDFAGTYVWIAQYIFNGKPKQTQKGTILLIK